MKPEWWPWSKQCGYLGAGMCWVLCLRGLVVFHDTKSTRKQHVLYLSPTRTESREAIDVWHTIDQSGTEFDFPIRADPSKVLAAGQCDWPTGSSRDARMNDLARLPGSVGRSWEQKSYMRLLSL